MPQESLPSLLYPKSEALPPPARQRGSHNYPLHHLANRPQADFHKPLTQGCHQGMHLHLPPLRRRKCRELHVPHWQEGAQWTRQGKGQGKGDI
jgi:hypothetical protein